jgi:hypothetical protein
MIIVGELTNAPINVVDVKLFNKRRFPLRSTLLGIIYIQIMLYQ